jgi:predicted RNase H-like nuclease (RuvC/YqgF family)
VQKVETEGRRELEKARERAETEKGTREREHERAIEEMDERVNRLMDENEDLRRKVDKLERTAWEHKQQAETLGKREER